MTLRNTFDRISPGHIVTIAGVGYPEDGTSAKEADAGWPLGVIRRPDGDIIVADHLAHRLWRIDADGILHNFAGTGVPGYSGDGGPAIECRMDGPHDLYQDVHGNLYFSDLWNNVTRRIDAKNGIVTTIAGNGKAGRGGDGGPATEAEMDVTCGVAADPEGNVYLASEWANSVRRIDAKTGVIETFAGYLAPHPAGPLPKSGPGLSLEGYCGDGGHRLQAAFYHPEHLDFDSKGNIYVADCGNERIRKIDIETGTVTTVLGNGKHASNGDGGPGPEASINWPDALCLDAHDNIYVGEKYGYRVRKLDGKTGIVSTLVGNGVPGFGEEGKHGSETLCNACEAGIWADPDGTVLWSDTSGRLRRYDGETGIVTTVFGGTSVHDGEAATSGFLATPRGIAIGPDGTVYVADEWNQRVRAIDPATGRIRTFAGNGAKAIGGTNGPATESWVGNPYDVAVDSQGRVAIAEKLHAFIRRVDTDGVIRIVAGSSYAFDRGDGGPAMGACFTRINALAYDADDNLYVGDPVGRIRRIDAKTWTISTVAGVGISGYTGDGGLATAARIGSPSAIRFDSAGNLYFADAAHHVVRRVDASTGVISTVVGTGKAGRSPDGTPAREAKLDSPGGLAVTPSGVVYVSDTRNDMVRRVGPDGVLTTIAGCGEPGDEGDGVPAVEARLCRPLGLALWGDDVLLISDSVYNRVRGAKIRTLEH